MKNSYFWLVVGGILLYEMVLVERGIHWSIGRRMAKAKTEAKMYKTELKKAKKEVAKKA